MNESFTHYSDSDEPMRFDGSEDPSEKEGGGCAAMFFTCLVLGFIAVALFLIKLATE